jgi:hypothetical protein
MNYSRSVGAMILSSIRSGASLKQSPPFWITFRLRGGIRVTPSALLLRSGSVGDEILWEAASSLRNAFAVSCISYGWQRTVGGPNALGNLFADQYDFYPLLPSASNDDLLGLSPAQTVIDGSEHFRGQTYPDVPVAPILGDPNPDRFLWAWLVRCWKLQYIDKVESWELRALFRSLAHAFRAARMPKGCDHVLFDYGINVGLWYSALECLLRPEDSQVGILQVLECLGKRGWQNHRLMDAQERQVAGQAMKLNFVQRIAHDDYRLRNNFLHGNAVSLEDLTHGETLGTGTYTHTFSRWCTKLLSSNLYMLTTSSVDPRIPRLRSSLQRHQLKRLKSSLRLVSQTILCRKPLSHFNWVDHARGRSAWQIWGARKYGLRIPTRSTD